MPFCPRVLYLDIYPLEASRRSSVLCRAQVPLGRKCLLSKLYGLPVAYGSKAPGREPERFSIAERECGVRPGISGLWAVP